MRDRFEEVFCDITSWSRSTFPNGTVEGKVAHLVREVEEFRKAYAANDSSYCVEVADIFILLMGLSDLAGMRAIDLLAHVAAKMAENRDRKWNPPDHEGVTEHVREPG